MAHSIEKLPKFPSKHNKVLASNQEVAFNLTNEESKFQNEDINFYYPYLFPFERKLNKE